jgi:hypothetical protein
VTFLRGAPVFSLVVLFTLALAGLFGLIVIQPDLIRGALGQETAGHISQHFREPHHRIHDIAYSLLLGTGVAGLLTQLHSTSRSAATQVLAAIPFVALALATALSNMAVASIPWVAVGAFTLLATTLHPAVPGFVGSLNLTRSDRLMFGLVLIAALPLLSFASANIGLQRRDVSEHAALGHYGFLAALALTTIGAGVLASLRPEGWRPVAWVAGLLPIVLPVSSLIFSDADSRLDLLWALAAIGWGAVFIAAAVARGGLAPVREAPVAALPRAGAPSGWAILSGAVVITVALGFVMMHLSGGGGPGLHTPPSGGH